MNVEERTIRVVVADDVPEVRDELADLIRSAGDMELVGVAADGVEALFRAVQEAPDVVVLDLRMPRLDGITAAHRITAAMPTVHVVMHSAYPDASLRQDAEWAGVERYLVKGSTATDLLGAIRDVARRAR